MFALRFGRPSGEAPPHAMPAAGLACPWIIESCRVLKSEPRDPEHLHSRLTCQDRNRVAQPLSSPRLSQTPCVARGPLHAQLRCARSDLAFRMRSAESLGVSSRVASSVDLRGPAWETRDVLVGSARLDANTFLVTLRRGPAGQAFASSPSARPAACRGREAPVTGPPRVQLARRATDGPAIPAASSPRRGRPRSPPLGSTAR